jgi:hypothetical protein
VTVFFDQYVRDDLICSILSIKNLFMFPYFVSVCIELLILIRNSLAIQNDNAFSYSLFNDAVSNASCIDCIVECYGQIMNDHWKGSGRKR